MIWGGRSILLSWEWGGGKKKLKKSEMPLLPRDIVEKVRDKILHKIMEDHKKFFVNEILQKIPFLQKEVMCVYVCVCVCMRPNYDVTITSHTSKNRFPRSISINDVTTV